MKRIRKGTGLSSQIQTSIKFIILFCLTLAVYAQTFDDPYHFDDVFYITNNPSIRNLTNWPETVKAIWHFQQSRFVVVLTFAINYFIHQLNVFGYHVVNFMIHLITACLVWRFGVLLLSLRKINESVLVADAKPRSVNRGSFSGLGLVEQAPFWAALLFAVHPVNTQAVVYLSQRCESLATLFYISAVCFYLQARISGKRSFQSFVPAFICGVLGMFSKETVISLPVTVIFLEFFFFSDKEYFSKRRRWLIFICICLVFVVPALLNFNVRQLFFSPINSQSHLGDVLTMPTYVLTQFRVFVRFIVLMILPLGLNLDYDFPMSHGFFEKDTLGSFLILVLILSIAFGSRKKFPALTFGIAWFFLTLSANLIPRAHVIFEHKTYLMLAGVLPAVSIWIFSIFKNQRILILVLCCAVLVFSYLTIQRTFIWRDNIALWSDVIEKSPLKARPYNHRGLAYKQAGLFELAAIDFTRVIELAQDDVSAYLNRGNLYKLMGMNERALDDYSIAIRLDPLNSSAYGSRSSIFRRLGQLDSAIADLNIAIELDPGKSEFYSGRAYIRQKQGDFAGAIEDCTRAIKIMPEDVYNYNNRGNLYLKMGNPEAALKDYDHAIRLQPQFAEAYLNRAVAEFDLRMFEQSKADLQRAQAMGVFPKAEFVRQLNEAFNK